MDDEPVEELAAAYRLEVGRVRQVREQTLIEALGEIAALRTGHQLAVRPLAKRVLEAVVAHTEEAVDTLIDAHFRAGERDAGLIGERIQKEFLNAALGSPPAHALFSARGVQGAPVAGLADQHASSCQSQLGRISRAVRDRALVRRSLAGPRPSNVKLPPGWPTKYEFLEPLGVGGFARVFSARDPEGNYVAIKLPDPDDGARRRGLREIDALKELANPNIIRLIDHADDGTWFAMPRAEAKLDVVADLARIDGSKLAEIVQAIADALHHAHIEGFLHRDLSPSNVLRVDDRWVVADWGLAKLPPEFSHSAMTKSGLGTAPWASPEVLSSPNTADQRSDLFSLGRIVGWLVAGQTPEVNRPTVMLPTSPWYEFVRTATQFSPGDRPASIVELMNLVPRGVESVAARPIAITEFSQLLWTIHMSEGNPTSLIVAYAGHGSEIERLALASPIPEVERLAMSVTFGRAADQIAEHVVARMPMLAVAAGGGRALVPAKVVEHATRVLIFSDSGRAAETSSIRWTREEHYPGGGYQAPTGEIPMSEFVPELMECVRVLDAEAASLATQAIKDARERNWSVHEKASDRD